MIKVNVSEELSSLAQSMLDYNFNDVVVLKDNTIIMDWHNPKDRVNFIFSCTKSVVSILIGILVDNHSNICLGDSIVDHLPNQSFKDENYRDVSIEKLLSMTSGIEWNEMRRGNIEYNKMVKGDWLNYVLSKEVNALSIGKFNYCDGNSLLLSSLINHYEGVSAHKYAEQFLFKPLGISKTKWKEQYGLSMGGTGLHMKSQDLLKIGYLVLNRGKYGDKRIVSSEWVDKMTTVHSIGYPDWFGNYGLHWWISGKHINGHVDMYYALGDHGQYLFVIPEMNVVTCIRKKVGKRKDMFLPRDFLFDSIFPYLSK